MLSKLDEDKDLRIFFKHADKFETTTSDDENVNKCKLITTKTFFKMSCSCLSQTDNKHLIV